MPHQNPSDDALRHVLSHARTIAVVGASNKPGRPSSEVTQKLIDWGYDVVPVNPTEKEVHGLPTVASLAEIGRPVDIVNVFRRAEDTPPVAEAAARIGARTLWLQLGIASEAAAELAYEGGMTVVMDACIKQTHERLRVHAAPDAPG